MASSMTELPITAVSAHAFCPRQAYLAHAEGARGDTRALVGGRALHHSLAASAVHLGHEGLGLSGVLDAVEPGPLPVEHKRGLPHRAHRIQLALYAMCLEAATGQPVPRGVLVSGLTRQREVIAMDDDLRAEALVELAATRDSLARDRAPPAKHVPHCRGCSLNAACLPVVTGGASASAWLHARLQQLE